MASLNMSSEPLIWCSLDGRQQTPNFSRALTDTTMVHFVLIRRPVSPHAGTVDHECIRGARDVALVALAVMSLGTRRVGRRDLREVLGDGRAIGDQVDQIGRKVTPVHRNGGAGGNIRRRGQGLNTVVGLQGIIAFPIPPAYKR